MKLTATNVDKVVRDCLYKDNEITDGKPPADAVIVEGVVQKLGFNPVRLEANKKAIACMLIQLPKVFKEGSGGGYSFLNACVTDDGEQWGEHRQVDALMCLGLATGFVEYCLPRDLWKSLPGSVPYFTVKKSVLDYAL